jgi:hypothetical protein
MEEDRSSDGKAAGLALLAAAAGSVIAMAHHPTSAAAGAIVGRVHGAMIVFGGLAAAGFLHFARRRGLDRFAVAAGLVAYLLALFAGVGAATMNGFVVPALAGRGDGAVGSDLFLLIWEADQALATLGAYAAATAFILWSADLLGRGRVEERVLGALGLLAGAVPAALLAAGAIRMNVAGATIVYGAQAVWTGLVGIYLIRRGTAGP